MFVSYLGICTVTNIDPHIQNNYENEEKYCSLLKFPNMSKHLFPSEVMFTKD